MTSLIIAFMLDGILSNFLKQPFLPLFTIVTLAGIFPYFDNKESKYLKYCAIFGLLYDIVYTNTLFLNVFIFVGIGFINIFIAYFFSNGFLTNILTSFVSVISYRVLSFIINNIFINISINSLLPSIYNSLIVNIVYSLILYMVLKKINTYRHKRRKPNHFLAKINHF